MPQNSIRNTENLHVLLWLLKDLAWISDFKLFGVFMVIPTVFVAVVLSYKSRADFHAFVPNLAVVCWILANSVWMIGEFFYNDSLRPIATVFFILGLLFISFYYTFYYFKLKE